MRARLAVAVVALAALGAVWWWTRGGSRVHVVGAGPGVDGGGAVAAGPVGSNDAASAAPAAAVAPAPAEAALDAGAAGAGAPADHDGGLTRAVSSYKSILRAQLLAVEPQLLECLDRAVKAGQQPTGRASLTFIIAPAGARIVVETTGIDPDETTLDDGPLLDCMRETARAMTFDSIPAGGDALSVHREVVVDKGILVDHRVTEYAVLRDSDPPFQ